MSNKYERKWKIATNVNKFALMSVSKERPTDIHIDSRRVNFDNKAKVLGLTLARTGTVRHIGQRINIGKTQSSRIRFIKFNTKT